MGGGMVYFAALGLILVGIAFFAIGAVVVACTKSCGDVATMLLMGGGFQMLLGSSIRLLAPKLLK